MKRMVNVPTSLGWVEDCAPCSLCLSVSLSLSLSLFRSLCGGEKILPKKQKNPFLHSEFLKEIHPEIQLFLFP